MATDPTNALGASSPPVRKKPVRSIARWPIGPIPAQIVLQKQDSCAAYVALIHSGIVKLVFEGKMGKELLLGFRSQGWWINSWFALANAPSMWRIETVTECIVTRYPIAAFADLVSSNPPIMMQLLASQSYELVILSRLIVDFAEAPAVPGRLLMMPVPKQ